MNSAIDDNLDALLLIERLHDDELQLEIAKRVKEIDKNINIVLWRKSCKHANWSNNPFLCKKDWFLEVAKNRGFDIEVDLKPSNHRTPDFEEQVAIEGWWQKQNYRVGILPGLFIHQYG